MFIHSSVGMRIVVVNLMLNIIRTTNEEIKPNKVGSFCSIPSSGHDIKNSPFETIYMQVYQLVIFYHFHSRTSDFTFFERKRDKKSPSINPAYMVNF